MASAEISVSFSLEASIHRLASEFVQQVFDEHGVLLQSMSFDWLIADTLIERKATVTAVHLGDELRAIRDESRKVKKEGSNP